MPYKLSRLRCRTRLGATARVAVVLAAVTSGQLLGADATAQATSEATAVKSDRLVVAVRNVPPFAMRSASGDWEGVSVDLWQEVAALSDIDFEYRELPLDETLDGLREGDVDVAIAAVSVTRDREAYVDFSHPYYVTGLSLAYSMQGGNAWLATLRGFVSLEFLSAVGSLALVLLAAGFAIWLFERKSNAEEFGHGDMKRGLGDGFWWSAVTMTTVGYGDKAPKTVGGRVVALIWMFLSLIIIASFTASIAASLTTNELASSELRDRPFSSLRVGVLEGSAAAAFTENLGARIREFDTVADALDALESGAIDTALHDAPILRYQVRQSDVAVDVEERVLVRDDYAFALAEGSAIRNDVNMALLSILFESTWPELRSRYLGESDGAM